MKRFRPITPSRRYYSVADFSDLSRKRPEKKLLITIGKSGGRNCYGRNTNINTGGGHQRRFRLIDLKRYDKLNIPARVASLEYDPNRTARIALLHYADGEKRYILAPQGLMVGHNVLASENAEISPGNSLPLKNIPTGQVIHNIELKRGRGGQLVRSAGTFAQLIAKEERYALVRMPSGEMRKIFEQCYATIGAVSNPDHQNLDVGKAGRSRWLGIRPHVRGVAKNPVDHPMGGGEGKSKGGRHPCTPSGKPTKGLKTRKNKRTKKFILKRRPTRLSP